MGIGGAAVYALALLAIRGLELLGALVARSAGSAGRWLGNGAAPYRASLYAPSHALGHRSSEMEEKKIPPRR